MSDLNTNNDVSYIATPLDKFDDYFNKLPIEMRLKIWGHAAGDPRTINVKFDFEPEYHKGVPRSVTGEKGLKANVTKKFRCITPGVQDILALGGAYMESRKGAKKIKLKYLQFGQGEKIYFQPDIDTIFLDVFSAFTFVAACLENNEEDIAGFGEIQHLATQFVRPHKLYALQYLEHMLPGQKTPTATFSRARNLMVARQDVKVDIGEKSSQMLRQLKKSQRQVLQSYEHEMFRSVNNFFTYY